MLDGNTKSQMRMLDGNTKSQMRMLDGNTIRNPLGGHYNFFIDNVLGFYYIFIIIIELTYSSTKLPEHIQEVKLQPAVLDCKDIYEYSSRI